MAAGAAGVGAGGGGWGGGGVVCTSSDTTLWAAGRSLGACADKSGRALTFSSLGGLIVAGWCWVALGGVDLCSRRPQRNLLVVFLPNGFLGRSRRARPPVQGTRDAARGEGSRCHTTQNILARTSPSFSSSLSLPPPRSLARCQNNETPFRARSKSGSRKLVLCEAAVSRLIAKLKKCPDVQNVRRDIIPSQREQLAERERGEKMQKMTMI